MRKLKDQLRATMAAWQLSLPPEFMTDVNAMLNESDRIAEKRKQISIPEYLQLDKVPNAVWCNGKPVSNLNQVRGRLYTDDSGNHDLADTIWVK